MIDKPLYIKLAPLLVIAFFIVIALILIQSRPTAQRATKPPTALVAVETMHLKPQAYTVHIQSYGLVRAKVQTQLTSQVGGKVVFVSDSLRDGSYFNKDELLISLEKADYEVALTAAEANYLQAEQALIEQEALAQQALEDWKRSGRTSSPAPLVLRQPQVAAAKAQLKAAEAHLMGAKLDLSRTNIRAPYNGRVMSKTVDFGNIISPNTPLADIYSSGAVEIKLPIRNTDIPLIELPNNTHNNKKPWVKLTSTVADEITWQGHIVRSSSVVDANSRQLYVVAEVHTPSAKPGTLHHAPLQPLRVNQYVSAKIEGKTLDNTIVIPNKTIYQGSYVYLYQQGEVIRQPVQLLWQNEREAIIKEGLQAGDQLVVTPLGQVASGTKVKLQGKHADRNPIEKNNRALDTQPTRSKNEVDR